MIFGYKLNQIKIGKFSVFDGKSFHALAAASENAVAQC